MIRDVHICCSPSVQAALDAERRLKRGERQVYCTACKLWRWPAECEHWPAEPKEEAGS